MSGEYCDDCGRFIPMDAIHTCYGPRGQSVAPPAAAPAVQTELTDERIAQLWYGERSPGHDVVPGYVRTFAHAVESEVRSLLSGTRTCVQAGDSQTQEIAHLAASQASRTSEGADGVRASGEAQPSEGGNG